MYSPIILWWPLSFSCAGTFVKSTHKRREFSALILVRIETLVFIFCLYRVHYKAKLFSQTNGGAIVESMLDTVPVNFMVINC